MVVASLTLAPVMPARSRLRPPTVRPAGTRTTAAAPGGRGGRDPKRRTFEARVDASGAEPVDLPAYARLEVAVLARAEAANHQVAVRPSRAKGASTARSARTAS
jgi:hypothetical protein